MMELLVLLLLAGAGVVALIAALCLIPLIIEAFFRLLPVLIVLAVLYWALF